MQSKHVIIIAAENGALAGGKVGGVGDVVRDLPAAISNLGWNTSVVTPSYGRLHKLEGARELGTVGLQFRGLEQDVGVWEVPGVASVVRNIVLEHDSLVPTKPGVVYHSDGDDRPYATDANKFAFFCAAVAAWLESLDTPPTVLHLHDWHAASLAVLREFDPHFESLKKLPVVLTIHNLSYQGQRPFEDDVSSFDEWFPGLKYKRERIADPLVDDCYNPMAAAIRLADHVNTVSPTYAEEILHASEPDTGFVGGEGLEADLNVAAKEGRLIGILNGCDYSGPRTRALSWSQLLVLARETVDDWAKRTGDDVHALALQQLGELPRRRPLHLLTSVGRVVEQKMRLFFEKTNTGDMALEDILEDLGDRGVLFLLGSGERRYEKQLETIAADYGNMIYFRGYSETLGNALYSTGDLFLMPSSFEPCGISQMLAMRDGQPCVVHGVGGLYDTVDDRVTGFVFEGDSPREQATAFAECVDSALSSRRDDPLQWQKICERATNQRFDWSESAKNYVEKIYGTR